MRHFTLTEAVPQVPPGISGRYLLTDPQETDRASVLVVAFAGEYPAGSLGNEHGAHIAAFTLHGLQVFNPHCIVLDFRDLSYHWGTTLLRVFQDISQLKDEGKGPGELNFPVLVVTSEKCRAALLSLLTPAGKPAPTWHYEDLDLAIEGAIKAGNEWLAS